MENTRMLKLNLILCVSLSPLITDTSDETERIEEYEKYLMYSELW